MAATLDGLAIDNVWKLCYAFYVAGQQGARLIWYKAAPCGAEAGGRR